MQTVSTDSTDLLLGSLRRWRSDQVLLARFFNTLSFLEHLGSRKILGCQFTFTEENLRHAAEESRHAVMFKKMSRALHPAKELSFDPGTLLGGSAAFWYFQRIDAMAKDSCQGDSPGANSYLHYLVVTYIVETRAAHLYPALQSFAEESGLPISLKGVIAEEDRHLEEIWRALVLRNRVDEASMDQLHAREARYFQAFISRLIQDGEGCYRSQ